MEPSFGFLTQQSMPLLPDFRIGNAKTKQLNEEQKHGYPLRITTFKQLGVGAPKSRSWTEGSTTSG